MLINTNIKETLSLERLFPFSSSHYFIFHGISDKDIGSKLNTYTGDKKLMRYPLCRMREVKTKNQNKLKKETLNGSNNKEFNGNILSLRKACL